MQGFQENSDDQSSVDDVNDDGDEEEETVKGIEASEQDDAELIETESKRDEMISSDEDESEMDDISGNMFDDEQNFDDKFDENGDEKQVHSLLLKMDLFFLETACKKNLIFFFPIYPVTIMWLVTVCMNTRYYLGVVVASYQVIPAKK